MLQQILRDMYIDPQLLAELDDEQKHILFCKMREEQVRRWEQREKELALNNKRNGTNSSRPGSKRVDFLLGTDGKPWTWVMGEHPEDPSIEDILEKETKEKARIQAAQEALLLRNQEEQEQQKQQQQQQQQQQQLQLQQQQLQEQQQKEIVVVPSTPSPPPEIPKDGIDEVVRLRRKKKPLEGCFSLEKEVAALLQDSVTLSPTRVAPVDRNTWLSQKQQEIRNREESLKQLMEQRSNEIYQEIKAQQRKSIEAAERESMVQEELWIEQEKKAKEVEKQIREIARIAREEHKRALHFGNGTALATVDDKDAAAVISSPNGKPPVPPKVVPPPLPTTPPPNVLLNGGSNGIPKNSVAATVTTTVTTTVMPSHATSRSKDAELFSRADIIQWFLKEEYSRGAVTDHNGNNPAIWFHGFIGRPESEQLLQRHGGAGAFLVRVHERIKGYVISYWAGDRCKHYLIDASLGHCQFFGSNQLVFPRLRDLVRHHATNPITALGQEQLLSPCPRNNSNNLFSLLPTLGQ